MSKNNNEGEFECKKCLAIQADIESEVLASEGNYVSLHVRKLEMAKRRLATVTHFETHDGELVPIDEFADYITAHHKKS